jgi:hypothetical protein
MCFPLTEPPPLFASSIVEVFRANASEIGTVNLAKGLTSDKVLAVLTPGLEELGFAVETGKTKAAKIERPVFFGEIGVPTLRYQIDAYHEEWRCGLEVEVGRAWMGNAIYRDLVQSLVMVQVDHLAWLSQTSIGTSLVDATSSARILITLSLWLAPSMATADYAFHTT